MSPHRARLVLAASAFTGIVAGYFYAQHSIALAIAHMKARYGWVCGTGLDFALYFWPVVGALSGVVLAQLALRLARVRSSR